MVIVIVLSHPHSDQKYTRTHFHALSLLDILLSVSYYIHYNQLNNYS